MDADPRELVLQELRDLPDPGLIEVLDFIRFLKSQWGSMSAGERFDHTCMVARRIAREQGITDQDIKTETERARQDRQ